MQNVKFDKFYVIIPCCEDFYCRVLHSKSLPPIFCDFRFYCWNFFSIVWFVFADFISCLSPEKPRNTALIYIISLKRVQRWRVSLIRSANDKNNWLSCLYANMSLLFSFNSNMKNILEIYVFSEWITTQYYVFFSCCRS